MSVGLKLEKNNFSKFFRVPFEVYPKDFPYVSLLRSDLKRFLSTENPLFRSEEDFEYWVAERNGNLVGRILCHVHRASNELHGWRRGYFGHLDAIDDQEVIGALAEKAESFARERGLTEVMGNFNLTAMQAIGTIRKIKINKSYTDQVFAPEHIAKNLEANGYESFFPMVCHEIDIERLKLENFLSPKQEEVLKSPEYSFDNLEKAKLEDIIEVMRVCLNNGFSQNPMFVPLSEEEIHFQAKDMMLIIDRNISCVARHNGKPVGVVVTIPNLNPLLKSMKSSFGPLAPFHFLKYRLKRDSALMIYYSVDREHHSKGINGAMLYKVFAALKAGGYKKMGGTWISLDNIASLRQVEKMDGEVMHELCLYKKVL